MWIHSLALVAALALTHAFLSAQSPAAGGNAPAASAASPAAGGPGATLPASGPDEIAFFGPYGDMVVALNLSAPQRQQILERYAQLRQAQAKYLRDNQKAWADAMAHSNSPDADEARLGKDTVAALQGKFDALTADGHGQILRVLTREQALTWEEKTLCDRVVAELTPVKVGHGAGGEMTATRTPLTAEQMKIVRAQCARAAREIQGWDFPYNRNRREPAIKALTDTVGKELAKASIPAPAANDQ